MSIKRCPKGKILVKGFKRSGKKISSYCRSKSPIKKKKATSKKVVKKSKPVSRRTYKKRSIIKKAKVKKSPSPKKIKSRSHNKQELEQDKKEDKLLLGLQYKKDIKDYQDLVLTDKDIAKIVNFYGNNINHCLNRKYKLELPIGKGTFGIVYKLCDKNRQGNLMEFDDCIVVKLQKYKDENEIKNEETVHNEFAKVGLSPELLRVCKFKKGNQKYAYFEMEPILFTLDKLLDETLPDSKLDSILAWIEQSIDTMCKNNLIHGDLHWANLGYRRNPLTRELEPTIIDFSWGLKSKCNPRFEYIQLLRTLYTFKNFDNYNRTYLENKLYDLYTTRYNKNLKRGFKSYDKEQLTLHKQHEKLFNKTI